MHRGVHGVRQYHLLAGLLLVAAACDDPARPPSPSLAAPASVSGAHQLSLDVLESDWDTYSADVSVTTEDANAPGYVPGAQSQMQFSVTRQLGAGNVWTTIDSFTTPKRLVASGAQPYLGRSVRVEDGVTPARVYDANGALVSTPALPSQPMNARNGLASEMVPPGSETPFPQVPTGQGALMANITAGGVPTSAARGTRGNPREWLDAIVITPTGRERARRARLAQHGAPQGRVRGLDRYVVQGARGLVVETLVDTALQAVVERNVAREGQLQTHITYAYERLPGGIYLQNRTRVERRDPRAARGRSAIEVTVNNVKVTRTKGGRP